MIMMFKELNELAEFVYKKGLCCRCITNLMRNTQKA